MNELHHYIFEHFILQCPSQHANHSLSLTSNATSSRTSERLVPLLLVLCSPSLSVTIVVLYYLPVFIPDREQNMNRIDNSSADHWTASTAHLTLQETLTGGGAGSHARKSWRLGVRHLNSGGHNSAHNMDLREVSPQHSEWYLEASLLSLKMYEMSPRSLIR